VIRDVLVDTGPLVALIDECDQHHGWARARFAEIVPPLWTCEAVLTEACFLARGCPGGVAAALELFERGVCGLAFELARNFDMVSAAMNKYADVPMSLADACLVRMAELMPNSVILTLDSDFRIYRKHRKQRMAVLMPGEA
jgi:uncharacterized protein